MVTLNMVGRLRHQNNFRDYRRQLTTELGKDFLLGWFPQLRNLPLEMVDSEGHRDQLADLLTSCSFVTLTGDSGSGRRLAFQQLALAWVADDRATTPIPILLWLPQLDDGRTDPEQLINIRIHAISEARAQKSRSGLPRLRLGIAPIEAPVSPQWLLLIHGWEDLPEARREAWRTTLLHIRRVESLFQILVALPIDEPSWPGFTSLEIPPPGPALISRWIECLLPPHHRKAVLEALAPDGPLHTICDRLFEVALLAWCAPRTGIPTSRAGLYEYALAELLGVPVRELSQDPTALALQLFASYGDLPPNPIPGLLVACADGKQRFVHPQIGRYLAARQLVVEHGYDLLHDLSPLDQEELALLITTMVDDPSPLFETLWHGGRLEPEDLLLLGECLRERVPANPNWIVRIIGGMAKLAQNGDAAFRSYAHQLLEAGLPTLDAHLETIARSSDRGMAFLVWLYEALPADLCLPRIQRLVYDTRTPEPLAWALTERLVALVEVDERMMYSVPAERSILARWAYMQALGDRRSRQLLAATPMALSALLESSAGAMRLLRAAIHLFDDEALPSTVRLNALRLLQKLDQSTLGPMLERAHQDADPTIRQGALEILIRRAPEQGIAVLEQIVMDQSASWETRLGAIQRLGDHLSHGTGSLLEQCANHLDLPYLVRMRAVQALGQQIHGAVHLLQILCHNEMPTDLRIIAARQLGSLGHQAAVEKMLQVLSDPATPGALTAGICEALGALQAPDVEPILLRLLATSSNDAALTLALVDALGRLRSQEAVVLLGDLLGPEAFSRLQRNLPGHLFGQPAMTCLQDPLLPAPTRQRLATALSSGRTLAERPTTLTEFLSSEADRVRIAAAGALARIGGNAALETLQQALQEENSVAVIEAIINAVVFICGIDNVEMLHRLLTNQKLPQITRWLLVQHLRECSNGTQIIARLFARNDLDPFTQGALAEALGQQGVHSALPLLGRIAEDAHCDKHLRSQAILALGLLDDPASEPILLRIIRDETQGAMLRGLAAEHLPSQLSESGRQFLRNLLNHARLSTPLIVGALHALGRCHDRESMTLIMRYCQDDLTPIVQAAIDALVQIGDENVTPVLVSLAHTPAVPPMVQLEAIGALLRLGGNEYRLLLNAFLNHNTLPLRLQALEQLIASKPPLDELLTMLVDHEQPLPYRLRILEHLADNPSMAPTLLSILADASNASQLRGIAAERLGRLRYTPAIPTLTRLIEQTDGANEFQLNCINALGQIGGTDALLILGRIAEQMELPSIIRYWALQALVSAEM